MTSRDRRVGWLLFVLLLGSYAYFYQGGGWNENSRFNLVRAMVEDHSLAIDRFAHNTGDRAEVGGHYYSDKAPGASFLAAPLYAALRLLEPAFRTEHDFIVFATYVLTVLTIGMAGAATGVLLYRAGRKLGASPGGAALTTVAYGLGTTAFPLSTMFFGHQLAGLCLFAAFTLAWDDKTERARWRSVAVALLCTASIVTEFPTAPVAAGLALYHVGPRVDRRTAVFLGWAALPALALGLYLLSAFGSPLAVGYGALSDPASRAEMQTRGFFGVSYPRLDVLASMLIGNARGLLPYSPFLFLSIPGFVRALNAREELEIAPPLPRTDRGAMWVALGAVVYFLLFVASYEWWEGGACFGSRHLAPALPFMALPITLVASVRPRLAVSLAVPAVAFMLIVTAVQPKPSERHHRPFWDYELPTFLAGELSASNACPLVGSSQLRGHKAFLGGRKRDAFNLGMLIGGGSGHRSLGLLFGLWAAAAWALHRAVQEADQPPA